VGFFTLLTILGGIATVATFVCGSTAMLRYGGFGHVANSVRGSWHRAFDLCVGITILSALTAI
jgi:hypothetical protein